MPMKPRALYSRAEPINYCRIKWIGEISFWLNLNWNWTRASQNELVRACHTYIVRRWLQYLFTVASGSSHELYSLCCDSCDILPIGLLFCLHNVWACVHIDAGVVPYPYVIWWILLWLCLLTDPVFLSIFVCPQVLIDPELRAVYDATGEVKGLERRGKGAAWEVWDNWSEFKPFQRKLVMTCST